MSSSESDALLQTRRKPNGMSWFTALSVGVFGVVAITLSAKAAFEAYRSSSKQLGSWEDVQGVEESRVHYSSSGAPIVVPR